MAWIKGSSASTANGQAPTTSWWMERVPISESQPGLASRKREQVRLLGSVCWAERITWFQKMHCKSSAFKHRPPHPSSGARPEHRSPLLLVREQTSSMARYLSICATTSLMLTTGFRTFMDYLSPENASMTLEEHWVVQSLRIEHSSSSLTKDSACDYQGLELRRSHLSVRGNPRHRRSNPS